MSDSSEGNADGSNQPSGADDYRAARGQPPRAYRFTKGTSGNPAGRPKGSKNFATLIKRELDRTVNATVGGRQTKVAKREAIVMRLVDNAMKGDHRSIEAVLKYGDEAASKTTLPPMDTDPAREREIMEEYLRRQGGGSGTHG
nr:DUF5681 domain-containing protein [Sphingomonas jinjuensis]